MAFEIVTKNNVRERFAPAPRPTVWKDVEEKDWNKLELQLVGKTVSLVLNGKKCCEYSLESTNQCNFGLFHFSDATGVRVRNVTYRGRWPQSVPALKEQELAQ